MSEEKKVPDEPKKDVDKELSDLLDSALGDFGKEPAKKTTEEKVVETKDEAKETGGEPEWSEEFLIQAAQQFENNLGRLLGESSDNANIASVTPEQIQQSFQKMAEAAQQVLTNPEVTDSSNDFSAAISQTLRGLSEGAENLQNPFLEQDFFNTFGTGAAAPEQNNFLPFMQGMMQSLLSKEVLYPSLKDILEKFPEWLRENESKLTPEEKERYQSQQKLMADVCKELENETEADSAEVKRQRFEKVLSLMQKLQDYGQPPQELVGDVGPTIPFDPQGNPDQCSLM